MKRTLIGITFSVLLLVSYEAHAEAQVPTATIEIRAESIGDFHQFLEGLTFLVASSAKDPIQVNLAGANKLSFRSIENFPGEPMMVHLLQDGIAVGSGASRQLLTIEALKKTLDLFAGAASSAGSEGYLLLISDEKVTGEFGILILNLISEAGIQNIMAVTPDLLEASRPPFKKKPSSPSPSNNKQNKSR